MANKDEEGLEELEFVDLDARRDMPGKAWSLARKLEMEKAAEFITPEQVYIKAMEINNPRDRALFTMAYVCAARIEELVRYKKIRWGHKRARVRKNGKERITNIQDYTKKKEYPLESGTTLNDVSSSEINGKKVIVFRLRNLKNKNRAEKTKLLPFPISSETDKKLWDIIRIYLKSMPTKEMELFPIGKRQAEKIINQTGFNPHFLRKLRLTHLAKHYNFTDQMLKVFAGWSDSRPSKYYIKLGYEDVANQMTKV